MRLLNTYDSCVGSVESLWLLLNKTCAARVYLGISSVTKRGGVDIANLFVGLRTCILRISGVVYGNPPGRVHYTLDPVLASSP